MAVAHQSCWNAHRCLTVVFADVARNTVTPAVVIVGCECGAELFPDMNIRRVRRSQIVRYFRCHLQGEFIAMAQNTNNDFFYDNSIINFSHPIGRSSFSEPAAQRPGERRRRALRKAQFRFRRSFLCHVSFIHQPFSRYETDTAPQLCDWGD